MNTVFFSICIPTYNSEATVEKAIESAINQTFKDYEIVIVDDGSTDNTFSILQKYSSVPNIRIHRNEDNSGMTGNWNTCMKLSQGKYVVFVHHDDSVTTNYLQDAWEIISKNKNIGLLSFENQLQKNSPFYGTVKGEDYFKFIFQWKYVIPPSQAIFINLKKLSYDKNLKYGPEADLYLQILEEGYDVYFSEKKNCIRDFGRAGSNVSTRVYYTWMPFADRLEMLKKWHSHPLLDVNIIYAGLKTTAISVYERRARAIALKILNAENLIEIFNSILNANNWFRVNKLKQIEIKMIASIFYVKKYITSSASRFLKK